jgi:hypothetical protein
MREDKQKNTVVISYVMSSEDGRFKKVKKRLTAKEQVEQIRSKRLIKAIKALANFCVKRTELYPN